MKSTHVAMIVAATLMIPIFTFAAPDQKVSIQLKVVSSKTKIHGSSGNDIFTYTSIMFTQVEGANVVYACAQKGDLCPLMETGQTYTAERDGKTIYIPMSFPDDKRPQPVKYKQVGTW